MMKTRRVRWAGHVGGMGLKSAYRVLVTIIEGNSPIGRPRRRREDTTGMDLR
jgi:hypothetical protein